MALVACRECGRQVSTEATTCPHCGVPRPAESPVPHEGDATGRRDYVSQSLASGERVLYRTRLHWIMLAPGILLTLVVIAAGVAMFWVYEPVAIALLVVAVLIAVVQYLKYVSSEFAVTDARVLIKVGWIRRRSIEVLVAKVESIVVDQGIAGRILDYGTVVITGTGGTRETFDGIASPLELRERVQAQIIAASGRA
jgi:membrane protein YdbS with pleckstrin-like domain